MLVEGLILDAFLLQLLSQSTIGILDMLTVSAFLFEVGQASHNDDRNESKKESDKEPTDPAATFAVGDRRADTTDRAHDKQPNQHPFHETSLRKDD